MIRGIPLQTQSNTNFDYLSLPPETLRDALRLIDPEGIDPGLTDQELSTRCASGEASISALTVTRDVRRTMEEVLGLLNEALAAQGR
jgi:hypothetical protein